MDSFSIRQFIRKYIGVFLGGESSLYVFVFN